jgi:hypothetical protein
MQMLEKSCIQSQHPPTRHGGFLGAPDEAMTNEMTIKRQVNVNTVEDDSVYVLYINVQKYICRVSGEV